MKKLSLFIFLILICYLGYSQTYPVSQNIGAATTLVKAPNYGGMQAGFIPYAFSDTSAANTSLTYGKNYNGFLIYNNSDSGLYYRSNGATKWMPLLNAGGVNGPYSWLVYGNGPFPSTIPPTIGTKGASSMGFITSNTLRGTLPATGIVDNNGAGVKVLGIDTSDATRPFVFTTAGVGSDWSLTGNAGTSGNTGASFLGTTDAQKLVLKSNNLRGLTLNNNLAIGLGTGEDYGSSGDVIISNGSGTAPSWSSHSSLGHPISKLTDALATNSIDNQDYEQQWAWSSLAGNALTLSTSSTAGGGIALLNLSMTGDFASQDPIGINIVNSKAVGTNRGIYSALSGASVTNIAGDFSATGGTTNIAGNFSRGYVQLGQAGVESGILKTSGSTSGTITIQPQAAAGTYNFNLPTTAGTSGQVLTSAGGGASPMTWTTPSGGTVTGTVASGQVVVGAGTSSIQSYANNLYNGTTQTYSANGAASTPVFSMTGNPSTAGTTTTDYPLFYMNGGTAPTTWNTNGTYLGINAVSGFTGDFVKYYLDGTARFRVSSAGVAVFSRSDGTEMGSISGGSSVLNIIGGNGLTIGMSSNGIFHSTNGTWMGKVAVSNNTPTALVHIPASTTAASSGQIKLVEGVNLTTPEDGNINYVSNNLNFTEGSTVYTLAKTLTNTATLNFGNTAAGTAADLTITVTGAAVGDAVYVGVDNASVSADNITFWGWVSATNTVTVRFNNNNLVAAVDPASGTFRVVVTKY